jgi:hypothetical protein
MTQINCGTIYKLHNDTLNLKMVDYTIDCRG